jgi:hypothetical protein
MEGMEGMELMPRVPELARDGTHGRHARVALPRMARIAVLYDSIISLPSVQHHSMLCRLRSHPSGDPHPVHSKVVGRWEGGQVGRCTGAQVQSGSALALHFVISGQRVCLSSLACLVAYPLPNFPKWLFTDVSVV